MRGSGLQAWGLCNGTQGFAGGCFCTKREDGHCGGVRDFTLFFLLRALWRVVPAQS